MTKTINTTLIIALCCLLLGGILFLVGCSGNGFDFSALSNVQIEQKEYVEESGKNLTELSLSFETANFTVNFDENAQGVSVSYPQSKNRKGENTSEITITETENSLSIVEKPLFMFSIFNFTEKKLVLTLPTSQAYALSFEGDTGDVTVNAGGSFSNLTIKASTGNISLSSVQAEQLSATVSTGNITVNGATVAGSMTTKASTGKTSLASITADALSINASTGDVKVQNATITNEFQVETSTGDITLLESVKANSVNVLVDTGDVKASEAVIDATSLSFKADTGDVNIKLAGIKHDYAITVDTSTGSKNISSNAENIKDGLINPNRTLYIETDTGNIKVYFTEEN